MLWLLVLQKVSQRVRTQLQLEEHMGRGRQGRSLEQVALCSWQRAQTRLGLRGHPFLMFPSAVLMRKWSQARPGRIAEGGQLAWCTHSSHSAGCHLRAPSSEESGEMSPEPITNVLGTAMHMWQKAKEWTQEHV